MTFETRNPPAARELLDQGGWVYLDVRTVEEFEEGHVPGAYNVPVALRAPDGRMQPNPQFREIVSKRFDPGQKIVFGCAMGGRSQRACEIMAASGYQHLINMDGGFHGARDAFGRLREKGWKECGFPVATGPCAERGYDALR